MTETVAERPGVGKGTAEVLRFLRVLCRRRISAFGLAVVVALVISAVLAPVLAPYDPNEQHLDRALLPPSREHWLGTDALGRDILSRVVYGARITLLVGVISVAGGAMCGTLLGLVAGYFGGPASMLIMRAVDAMMALPPLVLALAVAAALGGGVANVMIAIGTAMIPGFARLIRGETLSIRENEYVLAARALGAGGLWIMFRHVLPNCRATLIVVTVVSIGGAILSEAGLSFLGIGIEPPTPAWGSMIYDGYRYLVTQPMLSFAPGLALLLVVFGFNMLADGLRDALDPRLRGVL